MKLLKRIGRFRRFFGTFALSEREAKPLALCSTDELCEELFARSDTCVIGYMRGERYSLRFGGRAMAARGLTALIRDAINDDMKQRREHHQ